MPLAATAALLALPGVAQAGGPQQLLPDLVQEVPQSVQTQENPDVPGDWQLGFTSIVGNVGEGPMEIQGTLGANDPDMTAFQVVHLSDNSTEQLPGSIGLVHYENVLDNHDHWHFQPFDTYELRSLDGTVVAPDQKEGFCLVNSLTIPFSGVRGLQSEFQIGNQGDPGYFCNLGHPEATSITEGISVGWADEYTPFRGGQDVDVTGVPAGRYYLVHEVNKNHSIKELDDNFANNVATAIVDLSWPNGTSAKPAVKVLATCLSGRNVPLHRSARATAASPARARTPRRPGSCSAAPPASASCAGARSTCTPSATSSARSRHRGGSPRCRSRRRCAPHPPA